MRHPQRLLAAVAAGLFLTALVSPSHALSPDQRKCQSTVAKQGSRLYSKVARTVRACRDKIAGGTLPGATDCAVEPITVAKLATAEQRFADRLAKDCDDALVASLTFGDDCYDAATLADLTACESAVHQDEASAMIQTFYGSSALVSPTRRRCQRAIAKQAQRVGLRFHKLVRRCKERVEKGSLPPETDCDDLASTSNMAVMLQATKVVGKTCSDATVAVLDFGAPCENASTVDEIVACAFGSFGTSMDRIVVAEYGVGPTGGTASLKQITSASECVGGPLARCRVGDYLFENQFVRVVVQDIQRNLFGVGQFGGQIIDADIVRAPGDPDRDNFEEWSTALNIENTVHYTSLTIVNDGTDGSPAVLRASGVDDLLDFINPSTTVAGFGFVFPLTADDTDLPVEIVTDYILEPGRRSVRAETTVQNVSGGSTTFFFGETIGGSGEVEMFQPGYAYGEPLVSANCPASAPNPCNLTAYVGLGEGAGVSYGYVHERPGSGAFTTSGVHVPLFDRTAALALIGVEGPNFTLQAMGQPDDSITFRRYFVVADGSADGVIRERNAVQYLPTGTIAGVVTAGGSPVEGARVAILGAPGEGPGTALNVVTTTRTDASGAYEVQVAPGSYDVVAAADGHGYEGGGTTPQLNPVSLSTFGSVTQNVALDPPGILEVNITDENGSPIPGKVSVVGFDPSPSWDNTQTVLGLISNRTGVFGDREDERPFGVSRIRFLGMSGASGPIELEPGSYRVYASRGMEYSLDFADVTITAGATTPITLAIARVIDSTGFVGSDFHVHSINSPDSAVAQTDRVRTMLAEGVDFFAATDHDIRSDFSSTLTSLGATSALAVSTGSEMTSFDYGHMNNWPRPIDPLQVNGGSPDHGGAAPDGQDFPSFGNYSLPPADIVSAAKTSAPGTNTVQINHFYSMFGESGGGLAIDTGMTPPTSAVPGAVRRLDPLITNYFTDTFDALEIWIESGRGQMLGNFFGRNLGDWFNMINQGIVRTAVADSDTHSAQLNQAGFPRTMVASPTDDPSALTAIEQTLSGNVNAGRAFGTNGPFVRISADASSTGETAALELGFPTELATTDGAVDVTVDIQSPVWAEFDRVEFYINTVTSLSTASSAVGGGLPPVTVTSYGVSPSFVQTAGVDFAVSTTLVEPGVTDGSRLEATATLNLAGLTEDIWVVAIVRGTDGVSRPLFPVVPNDVDPGTNTVLGDLIDGNLGELGLNAMAYTNPLFVDVDGGGWTPPGVMFTP